MTALETVLLIVVLLLGAALVVGIAVAGRVLRVDQMPPGGERAASVIGGKIGTARTAAGTPRRGWYATHPLVSDAALAEAASNLDDVRATIISTRSEAAAARADAAAA